MVFFIQWYFLIQYTQYHNWPSLAKNWPGAPNFNPERVFQARFVQLRPPESVLNRWFAARRSWQVLALVRDRDRTLGRTLGCPALVLALENWFAFGLENRPRKFTILPQRLPGQLSQPTFQVDLQADRPGRPSHKI